MDVLFETTQGSPAIGIWIYFASNPEYEIFWCRDTRSHFAHDLPTEVEKIWRITLDKTAEVRLKIHCNGVEVVNVLLLHTCTRDDWSEDRSRNIVKLQFDSIDTASDYYRLVETGTYLKTQIRVVATTPRKDT